MKAPLHYRDPPQRSSAAIVGGFTGNITGNGYRREAFYAVRKRSAAADVGRCTGIFTGNGCRRKTCFVCVWQRFAAAGVGSCSVTNGLRRRPFVIYRLNHRSTVAGGKRWASLQHSSAVDKVLYFDIFSCNEAQHELRFAIRTSTCLEVVLEYFTTRPSVDETRPPRTSTKFCCGRRLVDA